jgi:spore germination protein GerM
VTRGLRVALPLALLVLCTAACDRAKKAPPPGEVEIANRVSSRSVSLFFEGDGSSLAVETRTVALPESDVAALTPLLEEFFRGPAVEAHGRTYPEDTVARGSFLLSDGTAVVDLGGPTLAGGWNASSHEEIVAVRSLVQTISANLPTVRRIRILVNGQPASTLAGHVAIERTLRATSGARN